MVSTVIDLSRLGHTLMRTKLNIHAYTKLDDFDTVTGRSRISEPTIQLQEERTTKSDGGREWLC